MNSNQLEAFLGHLAKEIKGLPHSYQMAFSASCSERAYPNYIVFSQLAHWGDPKILRTSLDTVWDFIGGSSLVLEDFDDLEQECRSVTPDLDDFNTCDIDIQAAAGQEAAFMVTLLLQFCRDRNPSYAVRIATFALDTIDMYVQSLEKLDPADPQTDAKVAQHSLMVQEMQNQKSDLATLARIKTLAELVEFRKRVEHADRSNLGWRVGQPLNSGLPTQP